MNSMKGNKDITSDIAVDDHNGTMQPQVKAINDTVTLPEDSVLNFTIWNFKPIQFSIFKPLLTLKLSLFLWFGVGAVIETFMNMYLKQRGMTLQEISLIYIITPGVQFLASVTTGIIADKIGRSKPVLVFNLLLFLLSLICIRLVPSLGPTECENLPVGLRCHSLKINRLIAETSCGIDNDSFHVRFCKVNCPENITQICDVQKSLICEVINRKEDFKNFSLSVHVNGTNESEDNCFYNVDSLTYRNSTYSWCDVYHKMYCSISCELLDQQKCSLQKTYRSRLYITLLVFMVLYSVIFTNTYRIMDVTAMCLVKDYNKDFGRQRVCSIMGQVVWSPLAGFIISITTKKGEPDNYDSAFYLAYILVFACLVAIWKLKVRINEPGKKMWKKSTTLIKKHDIFSFVLILLVLGATWGISSQFTNLFLKEELNASSMLISLLPSMSGIYGLTFLHSSNWWINKIGTSNVFVLALLGYSINTLGYSFINNPWWAIVLDLHSILTYHLLWVAVVTHSHSLAPKELTATVIASAGAIHFIIGKSLGSVIGGLSMYSFGGPAAFRIFSVMCFSTAVLYSVYLYLRRPNARLLHTFNDGGEKHVGSLDDSKDASTVKSLH